MKKKLTEKELEILTNLANLLPQLSDAGKNYLLGFGEALRYIDTKNDEPDSEEDFRQSA